MHNGKILCEGTQEDLREQFNQNDLEDVFFDLLDQQLQPGNTNELVQCKTIVCTGIAQSITRSLYIVHDGFATCHDLSGIGIGHDAGCSIRD